MTRLWLLAVFTCVIVVACDRVPLTSPTGSTISVSIDKEVLPIGGTATVTAVVTESSGTAPQNGTMVTFQPSIGRTDPIEAPTVNGKATVTYIAGSVSGTGVIHAFSGSARTGSGNSSAGGVTVKVGTAGTERIGVRTEPTNVPVTGGTVVVVASLFDPAGNPITNTPVTFSSDFGSLSSNSATTDANGDARVSLTTNRTTVVTVTAGSKTQTFTLNALNPPAVTLTCTGSPNATVGVPVSCSIGTTASGNSSSSAPIQNVTINWGDGTGEQPLGVLTGTTVVSHTYSTAGTFVVTAAATDANSQRGTAVTTLNVTRLLPVVTLSVPTTGTTGVPVSMSIVAASTNTQPITSVVVDFGDGSSRTFGSLTSAQGFTKVYDNPGGYTVTATATDASGQRGTTSSAIVVSQANPPTVAISQTGETTTPAVAGTTTEQFTVTASAASGLSLRSVVVTKADGEVLYSTNSGGQFATNRVSRNDILTVRATDSAGNSATSQVVVQ